MDNFAIYILKSTLSLSLMYLVYWLLFQRETFYTFNRVYLILTAIISLILPAFVIIFPDFLSNGSIQNLVFDKIVLDDSSFPDFLVPGVANSTIEQVQGINLSFYFLMIYLAGAGFFFIMMLYRLVQLVIILRNTKTEIYDGLKIVNPKRGISPFSFLHYVFINRNRYSDQDFNQILMHEEIHIKQMHTLDILFFEFVRILHWFNPLVWVMKKSLRDTHEYLADHGVLKSGFDKKSYQLLILKQSVGLPLLSLANTFVFSQTKRRILMLNNKKSSPRSKIKIVLVLPILLILIGFINSDSKALEIPVIEKTNLNFELPMRDGIITQKYAMGINPFTNKTVFHKGMDIAAPQGTKIYAAEDGVVLSADSLNGHGNIIVIQHANGFTTRYSHLYKFLASEYKQVKSGTFIGLVGSTGLSTAPHLHFEIRQNGEPVDPSEYLDFSVYGQK